MSEFLTTKEVAELLRIKERKVYDLAARNAIPCAKATGKLLFPKSEIRAWMQEKGIATESGSSPKEVILGSHDPVFEWALSASGSGLPTLFSGSFDGIARFKNQEGIACATHIENGDQSGWNSDVVQSELGGHSCVMIHWAKRERGLIIKPGTQVRDFKDIAQQRLVTRQAGTGSQAAFLRRLTAAGLDPATIKVSRTAQTETESALAILEDQADVAFGLRCFAERYRLDFLPICVESYDLVVDRHAFFEPAIQALLAFTRTKEFANEAGRYVGYDVTDTGKVLFNSAR